MTIGTGMVIDDTLNPEYLSPDTALFVETSRIT